MSQSPRRSPKVRIIALAAVCCFALFAFSASAFGMPIRGPVNTPTLDQVRAGPSPVVQPSDIPAGSAATTDAPSYRSAVIPAGSAATTDAPSYRSGDTPATRVAVAPKSQATGPSYRSGDTPATRVADAPTSQVTVTRTVAHGTNSHTLAIILAGSALGIALAGLGFSVLRSRMPKAAGLH